MRTMRALAVVLLLVVGVSACGSDDGGSVASGSSSASGSKSADKYVVDIKGFAFSPEQIELEKGEELTVTNDDSTEHTFTLDDGSFDSGHIKPGSKVTHTFDKAGSYSYHCEIHSTMKGTVKVS